MFRLVGIEEQGATAPTITTNLINTLSINADQHGIIVVRTNATDRVLIQILIGYTDEFIGSYLTILTERYHVQTILVASYPQAARHFVVVAITECISLCSTAASRQLSVLQVVYIHVSATLSIHPSFPLCPEVHSLHLSLFLPYR